MDEGIQKKLEDFFSQFKEQTYKKGEILIRADENPTGIFYLTGGIVKEYAISKKGEELVVNMFKPVSFFPMTWGLNETPNKYFFEALTTAEVRKAPREMVVDFLNREPEVTLDLLRRLYRGTDGLLTRLVYLMSGSAYARLITEILISAKRFGLKNEKTGSISSTISEIELATHAGLTRETVSREMKRLKDKGLVILSRNTLEVPDIDRLEEELYGDF
jgi:CRP/FNR family transcriptional regulator, anaerobic regulatory protein